MTTKIVQGWRITCQDGVFGHSKEWAKRKFNCVNWFGWTDGSQKGSISTTLIGNGRARLNFGNCNVKGTVKVFLDEIEKSSASANTPNKVFEFNFNYSKLKISEHGDGIIQFNSIEIIQCNSCS